jgi:hypothetical protein
VNDSVIGTAHTTSEIHLISMLPIKLCSCLIVCSLYASKVYHLAYIIFSSTSSNLLPLFFGYKVQLGVKYYTCKWVLCSCSLTKLWCHNLKGLLNQKHGSVKKSTNSYFWGLLIDILTALKILYKNYLYFR